MEYRFCSIDRRTKISICQKRRYYCDRYAIRNFPKNINIGTIEKIYIDNKTNYYTLDIKLFNDMTNLGHVYVLKSKYRDELNNLEKEERIALC
jgi:hypothetical protein